MKEELLLEAFGVVACCRGECPLMSLWMEVNVGKLTPVGRRPAVICVVPRVNGSPVTFWNGTDLEGSTWRMLGRSVTPVRGVVGSVA